MTEPSVRVTGRVMAVEPIEGGTLFRVTLGPAPDIFMFRARRPPKLGQRVAVAGTVRSRQALGKGAGSVSTLEASHFEVVGVTRRLVEATWMERVQAVMQRPLLPFQVDGAAWVAARLAKRTGGILGDDMGLGKTTQAIAAVLAVNAFPCIVVCPASVKAQWWEEFQYAVDPPEAHIIDGRQGEIPPGHVFILNYELLKWRREQLAAMKPKLYVFDEGQKLCHPTARGLHRASVATHLVRQTTGALVLTGTPVMNRPNELWRLLHLSNPTAWPTFAAYHERFFQSQRGKEIGRSLRTKAGRVERLDEFHAAVGPFMLRRLKSDVLKLPEKRRRSALVRLGNDEMTHYRNAEKNVVAWLRSVGEDKRALHAARSPGLTRLTYLRRIAAIGKLRGAIPSYLRQWFSQYGPTEPIVIFGYHRDVMLGLLQVCQELGVSVTGVGGGESHHKRRKRIADFQSGAANVFLAPIAVAGTGLNLQRACHALFVERIWTPSGMAQAEDRIHRLGQDRPVTVTYLDAAGTVDEYIAEVLEEKQRLIDAVVDDRARTTESIDTVIQVMGRLSAAS